MSLRFLVAPLAPYAYAPSHIFIADAAIDGVALAQLDEDKERTCVRLAHARLPHLHRPSLTTSSGSRFMCGAELQVARNALSLTRPLGHQPNRSVGCTCPDGGQRTSTSSEPGPQPHALHACGPLGPG